MKVFLDESGTHEGSRAVAVAGYLISDDNQARLQVEWAEVLAKWNVKELHMREFVPPHGKYAGMTGEEKIALFSELIATIHKYCVLGVGGAVEMNEFMRTIYARNQQKAPQMVNTPYEWCVRYCVVQVSQWGKENGFEGPIDYVLDDGGGSKEGILRMLTETSPEVESEHRIGSVTFADSVVHPGLQCADLLAYEMYKEMDRVLSESPRSSRKSFLALFRDGDRLTTVSNDVLKDSLAEGANAIWAIVSLLPPMFRFKVMCYGLRSVTDEQREAMFSASPFVREIWRMCEASGEMGMRLDEVPEEFMPPDDPDLLMKAMRDHQLIPLTTDERDDG